MRKSKIEWCDKTWNPVTGCTQISPGCANCYAKRMTERFAGPWGLDPKNPFTVKLHPEKLEEPLRWKKPQKIFVCSMSDLFHEDVPDKFLDKVFAYMAKATQHTFMVLTKRPERMRDYIFKAMCDEDCGYQGWYEEIDDLGIPDASPLENIWLGVTAENQEQADKRIPILLQTPAAKRFVSVEPMLGPVDLESFTYETWDGDPRYCPMKKTKSKIDWVICGGESGPNARPMHPDWARSLRDQCKAAGTPFLFKQWGEWAPYLDIDLKEYNFSRVGKKAAGRLLDGELWDQYPEGKDINVPSKGE